MGRVTIGAAIDPSHLDMGNHNSGRHRWRNAGAIENLATLDIRVMRRRGWLVDCSFRSQNLRWKWRISGQSVGAVTITANLTNPFDRHVIAEYELRGEPCRQRIAVIARPTPFAGLRFYFDCPVLHIPCEVLPFGAHGFGSRKANRITYASQGETKLGRLVSAKLKLYERLWPMEGARHAVRGRHRQRISDRYWDLEFEIDRVMDAG